MSDGTTEITIFKKGQTLGQPENLANVFGMPGVMDSLETAWPGDISVGAREIRTKQLIKQAAMEIASSRARDVICKCVAASVIDSLVVCASMGLSLHKAFGEAYLVPYSGVCTLMVGYRGFIKLLVNTGFVTHVHSRIIYDGEDFNQWEDEGGAHFMHKPDLRLQGDASKVVGAYAVGYVRGGGTIFEPMNAAELEKVKKSSAAVRSGKDTPYKYWETEMMRKAPIRRMQKFVPKTADNQAYEILAKAIEHDNKMFDLSGYQDERAEFVAETNKQKQIAWDKGAGVKAEPLEQKFEPKTGPITSEDIDMLLAHVKDGQDGTTDLSAHDVLDVICKEVTDRDYYGVLEGEEVATVKEALTSGEFDLNTGDKIPPAKEGDA